MKNSIYFTAAFLVPKREGLYNKTMNFSFFSLVPELKIESGHHYPYHKKVKEAVHALQGTFYGYIHHKSSLVLDEKWKKWFRKKNVPPFNLSFLRKMFLDFSRIYLFEKRASKRIFFIESFHTGDLLSFCLASFLFAKKTDQLWILFRFMRDENEMKIQAFLIKLIRKKCLILTDSELLIPELQKRFQLKTHLLSAYLSFSMTPSPFKNRDRITLSWLGGPRLEKGLRTIQKLPSIKDPLSKKFNLVLSEKVALNPSNELFVRFIKECLSEADYQQEFMESDVFLFPYEPKAYQFRTSGIFIETILTKKIPLVREGTWCAYELKKYGLESLIANWENPLFFTDLFNTLQDQNLFAKLGLMHTAYTKEHSMESFQQTLRDLIKD